MKAITILSLLSILVSFSSFETQAKLVDRKIASDSWCQETIPPSTSTNPADDLSARKYNLVCTISKFPGGIVATKKFSFTPVVGIPHNKEYNTFEFSTSIKDKNGRIIDTLKAHAEARVQFEMDYGSGQFVGGCHEKGQYALSSKVKNAGIQIDYLGATDSNAELNLILTNIISLAPTGTGIPNMNQQKSYTLSCSVENAE